MMDKADKKVPEKEAALLLDQFPYELANVRRASFVAGFLPPLPYFLDESENAFYWLSDVLAEAGRRRKI